MNNRLMMISAMLTLSACSSLDMQGSNPQDYYAQNPIKNKVGANGELISPDCPDWKTSPVTTYSNSKQGNIGCATTVNFGLMLEDPRDLERGASAGHVTPDADRNADAINNYRTSLSKGPAPAAIPSASAMTK